MSASFSLLVAHRDENLRRLPVQKPQDGPRWPQDGPRWPQDGPRWPQDRPKVAPSWPQEAPSWTQVGPRMAPRWPQGGPKRPQDGSEKALRNQTSTYKEKCRMPRRSEGYARTAILSWARLERGRLRIHVSVATRPDPARPGPHPAGHFDHRVSAWRFADLGPSVLAAPARVLALSLWRRKWD